MHTLIREMSSSITTPLHCAYVCMYAHCVYLWHYEFERIQDNNKVNAALLRNLFFTEKDEI